MGVSSENSSVGRARPCQGRGRGFESRFSLFWARVVESVDTPDLKSCGHLPVRVQVPPRVQYCEINPWFFWIKGFLFHIDSKFSGCSSVGRVLVWGARSRRFKSCHPDTKPHRQMGFFYFLFLQYVSTVPPDKIQPRSAHNAEGKVFGWSGEVPISHSQIIGR